MPKDRIPTPDETRERCCISRDSVRTCLATAEDANTLEEARAALLQLLSERVRGAGMGGQRQAGGCSSGVAGSMQSCVEGF